MQEKSNTSVRCGSCRYWYAISKVHDSTEWRNCLGMPYPACVENMTHRDADCVVPDRCERIRIDDDKPE